jgi:vacuolar protein sorting-associated protein 35
VIYKFCVTVCVRGCMQVLAAAAGALGDRGRGLGGDGRAERQLVALLSVPIAK